MVQDQAGVTDVDRGIISALVGRIHASPCQLVMHITGGGMAAITDLLVVGGASRSILEVTVPYSHIALSEIVGTVEVAATSRATALALAEAALARARSLGADADTAIGIGCTAALTTNRARRGSDHADIVTASAAGVESALVEMSDEEGELSRSEQDRLVADAVITAIDSACDSLAGGTQRAYEP